MLLYTTWHSRMWIWYEICVAYARFGVAKYWIKYSSDTKRICPVSSKRYDGHVKNSEGFLDFDSRSLINNSIFHYYIGFSKSQFQEILQSCISQRYKNKAGRALATVITKLHTGESNQRLPQIINMSRKTLEKTMKLVRQDLIDLFLTISKNKLSLSFVKIDEWLFQNLKNSCRYPGPRFTES